MKTVIQKFTDNNIQGEYNNHLQQKFDIIFQGYTVIYSALHSLYAFDNLVFGLQFSNKVIGLIRICELIVLITSFCIMQNIKLKQYKRYIVFVLEIANFIILIEKFRFSQFQESNSLSQFFHGISICSQYSVALIILDYQILRILFFIALLVYMKLRIILFSWNNFIYFLIIGIILAFALYYHRRLDMKKFLDFTLSQQELKDIKQLINNSFPEGIMIFQQKTQENNNNLIDINFLNKQFLAFLDKNSNIKQKKQNSLDNVNQTGQNFVNLQISSIQVKSGNFGTDLANILNEQRSKNFLDFIYQQGDYSNNNQIICIENKFESFQEFPLCDNDINTQYYKVKFSDCVWDQKPSKMLILEDYSQKIKLEQIQVLSQYKDKILATVSHDLKTPINGIVAQIESIQNTNNTFEQMKNIFEIVKVNMQLLLYMVYDIQDYSQIKKKKLKIISKVFNIKQSIQQCIELIKIQSKIKNLEIIVDIQLNQIQEMVFNDEIRYKQILLNLLSNALKCTLKGFIKIEVQANNDHNSIITKVIDSGIGIPRENIEKLFQFYYTNLEDEVQHGVGLGLAISKNLVGMIGPYNQMQVSSEENKGSQFSFQIYQRLNKLDLQEQTPQKKIDSCNLTHQILQDNEQMQNIYQTIASNKNSLFLQLNQEIQLQQNNNLRLLIVDDDVFCLLAFKSLCKSDKNIIVQEAYNGQQAIQKFNQEQFDAVFTDYNMPVMNGFELLQQIKKIKPQQIVYILSGNNEQNIIDLVMEAGARNVIRKPINKDNFLDTINEIKKLKINQN